jgi:hypothetical protein
VYWKQLRSAIFAVIFADHGIRYAANGDLPRSGIAVFCVILFAGGTWVSHFTFHIWRCVYRKTPMLLAREAPTPPPTDVQQQMEDAILKRRLE